MPASATKKKKTKNKNERRRAGLVYVEFMLLAGLLLHLVN